MKPSIVFDPDGIPDELKARPQWVLWRPVWVPEKKKWTKRPYQAQSPGTGASSTNPQTWASWLTAAEAAREHETGVGFVFADGTAGVDLDHVLVNGTLAPEAARIVHGLKSYAEVSPSGDGVHVFVQYEGGTFKGKKTPLPETAGAEIETYSAGRFFTVTGRSFDGTPPAVEERTDLLDRLITKYHPIRPKTEPRKPQPVDASDEELLRLACAATNGASFRRLYYDGDISSYSNDASSADMALMCHLAFWTGREPSRMDHLFSNSALGARNKWIERADYREMTVTAACERTTETYSPPRERQRPRQGGDGDETKRFPRKQAFVSPSRAQGFKPFPTEVLPEPLCGYVENGAEVIGCDPSFIALPLLSALAAAIGATHSVELKRGWSEPCVLWAVTVADSGTLKSPALDHAVVPVYAHQRSHMASYIDMMKDHERESLLYEKDLSAWKRGKGAGEPPEKPEEPVEKCLWTSDATVEALAGILSNNPRGTLLVRDELSAWLGAFDRYSGGSADAGHWLQMFGGRPLRVHRKTSGTVYVPSASVSICGGIQPGVLQRALGSEHREDGLLARLLLTSPPRRPRRWSEAERDPELERATTRVFDNLYALQPAHDEDGSEVPQLVRLDPRAKDAWIRYYNEHGEAQASLSGDIAAAWSKLEGSAARLALVFHMVRYATGEVSDGLVMDENSVMAGVTLSRWFANETIRVYSILSESAEDREQRLLLEWIVSKGGAVTARELSRGPQRFRKGEAAEVALVALVEAGLGGWEQLDHGGGRGRQTRRFCLSPLGGDGDTNASSPRNSAFVSPSPVSPLPGNGRGGGQA